MRRARADSNLDTMSRADLTVKMHHAQIPSGAEVHSYYILLAKILLGTRLSPVMFLAVHELCSLRQGQNSVTSLIPQLKSTGNKTPMSCA